MAHRAITLTKAPPALSEALQFTLSLQPVGAGQQIAQREIISALQNAQWPANAVWAEGRLR